MTAVPRPRPGILLLLAALGAVASAVALSACSGKSPNPAPAAEVHLQAASRAYAFDDRLKAGEEAQAATQADADCAAAWRILGHLASDAEDFPAASEFYQKALEADGRKATLEKRERAELLLELGSTLVRSSQFSAAEQAFTLGIGKFPERSSDFRYGLALTHHRTKQDDLALVEFSEAMADAEKDGTLGRKVLQAGQDFRDYRRDPAFSQILAYWTGRIPAPAGPSDAPR